MTVRLVGSVLVGTVMLGSAAWAAQAPTSVTIAAAPATVAYEGSTTVSGTIAPARTGERVAVQAQPCGETRFSRVANVDTVSGGAWSTAARPTVNTHYRAEVRRVTSATVSVGVSPRVRLTKVTRRKFTVRVFAVQSLAGKVVTIQRFKPATGTWARVRRSTLRQVSTGPAPTIVSGITFRARIPRRARVRVVLPQAQAAPCYLGARSNVIRA